MRFKDPALPDLTLSDDFESLDLNRVHGWLTDAYWCRGIPRETVERAARGSLVFGVFDDVGQVGYARVVTDHATVAWICDVVVDPAWRGRGVGKALVRAILAHPSMQGLRRLLLATANAHGLYAQFGFVPTAVPERWMEIVDREVYSRDR